ERRAVRGRGAARVEGRELTQLEDETSHPLLVARSGALAKRGFERRLELLAPGTQLRRMTQRLEHMVLHLLAELDAVLLQRKHGVREQHHAELRVLLDARRERARHRDELAV